MFNVQPRVNRLQRLKEFFCKQLSGSDSLRGISDTVQKQNCGQRHHKLSVSKFGAV